MVVAMPPTRVAKPIGISTRVGEALARRHALMRIGSSSTTMGVLLTKADSTAPTTSVANNRQERHPRPRAAQEPPNRFEGAGDDDALSKHHKRAYGDERLVAEPEEQPSRLDALEGEHRKADGQEGEEP